MANKAILRVAKIKTMSSLAARGKHNFRERETPNADAERTPLNQVAGASSADDLMQKVSDLLPAKRRKDAVIGLEYLITASPEHFGADWREKGSFGTDYFNDAIRWLQERHGVENVLCATVHLDESTPHLAAFVVPRTRDGRLAAKDFVGGAAKLSKMQTEFAAQVGKKHGLERGEEWSKAVHKPNAAIAPMSAERLALRKQVKALEAEIERLTKRVSSGDAALANAEKKFQQQQQLNIQGLKAEDALSAKLAAAQAEAGDLRKRLDVALSELVKSQQAATQSARVSAKQLAEVGEKLGQQGAALAASQDEARRLAEGLQRAQQEAAVSAGEAERAKSELRAAQARLVALEAALAKPVPPPKAQAPAEPVRMKAQMEKQPEAKPQPEPAPEIKPEPVEVPPVGIKPAGKGQTVGEVKSVKDGYLVQSTGPYSPPVAHRISELGLSKIPEVGQVLEIDRRGSVAKVVVRGEAKRGGR